MTTCINFAKIRILIKILIQCRYCAIKQGNVYAININVNALPIIGTVFSGNCWIFLHLY